MPPVIPDKNHQFDRTGRLAYTDPHKHDIFPGRTVFNRKISAGRLPGGHSGPCYYRGQLSAAGHINSTSVYRVGTEQSRRGCLASTGKTPEHFINEVMRFTRGWERPKIREELENSGIDPGITPDFRDLSFVQIDEFYPINPRHSNSFYSYVTRFYIDGFGIPREKALLITLKRLDWKRDDPRGCMAERRRRPLPAAQGGYH